MCFLFTVAGRRDLAKLAGREKNSNNNDESITRVKIGSRAFFSAIRADFSFGPLGLRIQIYITARLFPMGSRVGRGQGGLCAMHSIKEEKWTYFISNVFKI